MNSYKILPLLACFPLCECSTPKSHNFTTHVCIHAGDEMQFLNNISTSLHDLGYQISSGSTTDTNGDKISVIEGTRQNLDVLVTNSFKPPSLNGSDLNAEATTLHNKFDVLVNYAPKEVGDAVRTLNLLKSQVIRDGYEVRDDDRDCLT